MYLLHKTLFIHHLFITVLLSAFYALETILNARNTTVNKRDNHLCSHGAQLLTGWGGWWNNINKWMIPNVSDKKNNKTGRSIGSICRKDALLHTMFREDLTETCPVGKDLTQVRGWDMWLSGLAGRTCQAEETASSKALRQQEREVYSRISKQPVGLKWSKRDGMKEGLRPEV